MTSLQYLILLLSPHIRSAPPAVAQRIPLRRFALLDDQDCLSPDCVYLSDPETARRVLPGVSVKGQAAVILSGQLNEPVTPMKGKVLLIATGCTLPRLCNTVTGVFDRAVLLMRTLSDMVQRSADLQHLLAQAAELGNIGLMLLNSDNGVVAAGGLGSDTELDSRAATSTELDRTVRELFSGDAAGEQSARLPLTATQALYGRRIDLQEDFHGVLIAECREREDFDCGGFCDLVADAVGRMIFHPIPQDSAARSALIKEFFADVVKGGECDPDHLRELMHNYPFPVGAFLRLMVVTLDGGQVPYRYATIQLRQVFPESVLLPYRKSIIVLYTYDKRTFSPNLDNDRLHHLLERYNGHIGISNGTRDWRKLRSLYLLTAQTLRVAKEIHSSERIFFYENYGMYCVIDLCAQKFVELHAHDDILYLVHPAVVHISRHDRRNRDNLRDVLFYYLLSDRNVAKTAAAAYMHRNTILKKVARLSELVNIDFEDGELRHRLLFSCQVIHYYERYMKQKLRL